MILDRWFFHRIFWKWRDRRLYNRQRKLLAKARARMKQLGIEFTRDVGSHPGFETGVQQILREQNIPGNCWHNWQPTDPQDATKSWVCFRCGKLVAAPYRQKPPKGTSL